MSVEKSGADKVYEGTDLFNKRIIQYIVASNVQYYRKLAYMTQKELAEALGVSQEMVSHIETGRKRVPPGREKDIAKAVGCRVEDLLHGHKTWPPNRNEKSSW